VRLLPGWYQEVGSVYLYYSSRTLLPAKTRVFVDFVLARFDADGFARRMRAD
jgi:DNA-binding transcriptional LysR family regulator